MLVTHIENTSTSRGRELTGEVIFESVPDFHRQLRFQFETDLELSETPGDTLFVAFFVPAMALGRRFDLNCSCNELRMWWRSFKTAKGRKRFRRRIRHSWRRSRARLLSSI